MQLDQQILRKKNYFKVEKTGRLVSLLELLITVFQVEVTSEVTISLPILASKRKPRNIV